jgi:hypothetical protein
MGIAYGRLPGIDRKRVGKGVCCDVAIDIDEADAPRSMANRRIATILTVATLVQRGDDTNGPVARSKAEETSLHRAGAVDEEPASS